jgi:hypothetical protein
VGGDVVEPPVDEISQGARLASGHLLALHIGHQLGELRFSLAFGTLEIAAHLADLAIFTTSEYSEPPVPCT